MYICIYVYMYICIYVFMYICIYVYMYLCIYVYVMTCMAGIQYTSQKVADNLYVVSKNYKSETHIRLKEEPQRLARYYVIAPQGNI